MIRHVVLFRANRAEDVPEMIQRLRSLDGKVPSLRAIEVGRNVVASARAYDVALVATFDDLAGLEAYQVDPFHAEVAAFCRAASESIVAADYEA